MTDSIEAFRGSGAPALPSVQTGGAVSTTFAQTALPETVDSEFNLRTVLLLLLKWRWLLLAFIMTGLVIATAYTLLQTPLYRASTTIEIKRQETQIMKDSAVEPISINDPAYMATQFGLIQSRDLAVKVAQSLNLASSPIYAPQALPRPARENIAVAKLRGGLAVAPVGISRLMTVSFVSTDRNEAARIANAYADTFIQSGLERRYDATAYARNFLQQRIAAAKTALDQSERQLVAYARAQGIMTMEAAPGPDGKSSGGGSSLDESSLGALNGALSEAQNARMTAQGRYQEALQNGVTTETMTNSTIQALQGERSKLYADYQEKLGQFKPEFPQMREIQARIAALDNQMAKERSNVSTALRSEYQAAVSHENALKARVNQLKGSVMDLRDRSIQYNILQRDADTNRSLYGALLERYKQIGVAGGIGESQASIVDHAIPPGGPFSPRLMMNLAIALLISALAGLAVIFAIEFIDDTVKVPEDVESKLKMSVLGVIPKLDKGTSLIQELSTPRSKISEAYFTARTALQFSAPEGTPRVLLVTSTRPSEGKSSSALGLAQSFAKVGLKVLLIDGDMRKPSFTAKEGDLAGLSGLLAGGNLNEPKILSTNVTNLWLLPSGPIPPNPAELLASSNLVRLLAIVRERFDVIFVDGPPILGLADAPLLGAACDGTVVVVESGAIRRPAALNSIRQLRSSGARVMGVLLTKYNPKFGGYGYGYGYGYGADGGDNEQDKKRRIELLS